MVFTAKVVSEAAARLAGNEDRSGAFTPGTLFGPEPALKAGEQFIVDTSMATTAS